MSPYYIHSTFDISFDVVFASALKLHSHQCCYQAFLAPKLFDVSVVDVLCYLCSCLNIANSDIIGGHLHIVIITITIIIMQLFPVIYLYICVFTQDGLWPS